MSYDLPGMGDAATWGPCSSPRDPRATDDDDPSFEDELEAFREARDWIELAESSHIQGNAREYVHRLGCALDILKSLKECAK